MNISRHTKLVENIKSVALVVLLFFTILLLYFFWGAPFRGFIKESPPEGKALELVEIFRPDRINVCFGGNTYTVTSGNFDVIMDCFRAFSAGRNLSLEEIPKDRYDERMRQPSIKAVFEYFVPFSAVCEIYGIERIPGSDNLDALTELGYTAEHDDRLFVYDKKSDKYYRIIGNSSSSFEMLKNEIAEAEKIGATFYPLETYMGGEITNSTLCPFSFESGIHDIVYSHEDFSVRAERTSGIIKGFFSGNFDFVRRIEEESGTVIYMYGYGRIVVVAHNNGVLEFKREDGERASTQLRYLEAFERANAFIAAHGAFDSIDGGFQAVPYIKEVVADPEGKRGFRFVFGLTADGSKVFYQSGSPITVDVMGGRVTYFKRDFINVRPNGPQTADRGVREVFSAFGLLWNNERQIREILAITGITGTADISFEELAEMVTNFDCGYFKPDRNAGGAETEDELKAAWVVSIGGLELFFGLDDGKPLGYRNE